MKEKKQRIYLFRTSGIGMAGFQGFRHIHEVLAELETALAVEGPGIQHEGVTYHSHFEIEVIDLTSEDIEDWGITIAGEAGRFVATRYCSFRKKAVRYAQCLKCYLAGEHDRNYLHIGCIRKNMGR